MEGLPSGTVRLLFWDIEGSTGLLRRLGPAYEALLTEHRRLLRDAFAQSGGKEVETRGDSFLVAFGSARAAVEGSVAAQRALAAHSWPDGVQPRVRMGVHTGEPTVSSEGYVGFDVHRAARIGDAANAGQVLVSSRRDHWSVKRSRCAISVNTDWSGLTGRSVCIRSSQRVSPPSSNRRA